jgi:hypothetical protein
MRRPGSSSTCASSHDTASGSNSRASATRTSPSPSWTTLEGAATGTHYCGQLKCGNDSQIRHATTIVGLEIAGAVHQQLGRQHTHQFVRQLTNRGWNQSYIGMCDWHGT